MTAGIFNGILRKFDQTLQTENKHALLFVDNAGRHVVDCGNLKNLGIEFRSEEVCELLPANAKDASEALQFFKQQKDTQNVFATAHATESAEKLHTDSFSRKTFLTNLFP